MPTWRFGPPGERSMTPASSPKISTRSSWEPSAPDYPLPSSACVLEDLLGARNVILLRCRRGVFGIYQCASRWRILLFVRARSTRLWSSVPTRSAAGSIGRIAPLAFSSVTPPARWSWVLRKTAAGILSTKLRTDGSYVKNALRAGGRLAQAGDAGDRAAKRTYDHDERQRSLQDRRAFHGGDQPPGPGRGRRRASSRFHWSSRTRPIAGSSSRSPTGSACRWKE